VLGWGRKISRRYEDEIILKVMYLADRQRLFPLLFSRGLSLGKTEAAPENTEVGHY
jgi:hypothetical protein